MKSSIILTLLIILIHGTAQADVTTVNNKKELLSHIMPNGTPKETVIKVSTDWCGPCKLIKEPYKNFARQPEFADIVFLHIDGDTNDRDLQKFLTGSVPTFLFMRGESILHKDNFSPNDFTDGSVATMINKTFNRKASPAQLTDTNEKIIEEKTEQTSSPQSEKSQSWIKTMENHFSSIWQSISGFFLSMYHSLYNFFTCKK